VNLHILAKRFTQLSRSVFFDPAFREFSEKSVQAIVHVIENVDKYPDDVVRKFESHVWRVMQFVRGSRSSDAPHETQYVLRKALKEWIPHNALISSAALEDFNFFLNTEDIWDFIDRSLNHFDTGGYKPLVVRIGSPEAFKHRPVYCVPLFHELGHFVDHYYEISKFSLLLSPPPAPPLGVNPQQWQFIHERHRMEHFADLFASCYCGEASNKSLLAIAPNNLDSPTHPATAKRVGIVNAFLAETQNLTIDLLQNACLARSGQNLTPKFKTPDVKPAFDDVLTYEIANDRELYGIYLAGWNYLHEEIDNPSAPWIDDEVTTYGVEKTVNDLVEKSIRNFEIKERWSVVVADKN
jgi:hypothetical protein